MLTIAYYTRGTAYEEEAELLRASLDAVEMEHQIVGIQNRGDWYANTAYKALFLREQRSLIPGPLLYIDVDAYVHENCDGYFERLALRGIDFGAHWFRGPAKGHNRRMVRADGWWMLSGTLFLGDTAGCADLLDTWVHMNALFRERGILQGGGQKNLWFLVTAMESLKIERIPGSYCFVFDKSWAYPSGTKRIIEHTIASREHRDRKRRNQPRQARIRQLREAA